MDRPIAILQTYCLAAIVWFLARHEWGPWGGVVALTMVIAAAVMTLHAEHLDRKAKDHCQPKSAE